MSVRLPVNCDYPNCRAASIPPSIYCTLHQKPNVEEKRGQEQNRNRTEPWRKWYHTAHWRKIRIVILRRDPVCKICNRAASTVADHIKPHKGIWELFVALINIQGVCKPCHDTKTATEDGGFGNTNDPGAPVPTGDPGKQYSSSSVGEDLIDKALQEEI